MIDRKLIIFESLREIKLRINCSFIFFNSESFNLTPLISSFEEKEFRLISLI